MFGLEIGDVLTALHIVFKSYDNVINMTSQNTCTALIEGLMLRQRRHDGRRHCGTFGGHHCGDLMDHLKLI